uniref:T cell receptor delta constant n=1 Tax=Cebus imitator TaxID=2715852 RepID=A0A2K5RUA3_CEBIM
MCSWDTRQMFFGTGTKLFVEPQIQPPTKPSVFVMKNGKNVACLVKDFYPKDISINLKSSKKITEFDPAIVVSPSGKYNAVKLGQYEDSNSVTCSVQHNNTIVHSTDFELRANSSDNLTSMQTENTKQSSKSCHEPKVHAEKVNMMSLTVLGLRMLLAKSVAINFLLTAKLFFF